MMSHQNRLLIDSLFLQLKQESENYANKEIIILESQQSGHLASSKTFIAAFPKRSIQSTNLNVTVIDGEDKIEFVANPWDALQKFRNNRKSWLFGYLGYDLKNSIENVKSNNNPLTNLPDLFMMEPSVLLKVSNGEVESIIGPEYSYVENEEISECLVKDFKPHIIRDEYIGKVKQIQHQIKEGDFYEMNFSYPMTGTFEGDSFELYRKMREINPVPFGAYLSFAGSSVCCASPERFLKKSGSKIVSEPIKGTSARSTNKVTDKKLREELRSEKNQAENLMIVDLVRHDFSKVSKTGSVNVTKLYDIQTFGTVHQLISRVEGKLKEEVDAVDALKSCFPMGSMTGAPKLRVMQEIEHHEEYRRGIYSGAIGYFTPNDNVDFNVVIRTAVIEGNSLVYSVGGAITGDSVPEKEWEET
ncbi:MAG: anthranilate synthase component I family protein, partial [Balneolaceae bacterium]